MLAVYGIHINVRIVCTVGSTEFHSNWVYSILRRRRRNQLQMPPQLQNVTIKISNLFQKNLKIMCINCYSLRSVDKHAELNCLVNHHNLHIILGRDSRLGTDIPSCEVFPKGFRSFHRERVMGGIFILVREDIYHVEDAFPNDNKDSECLGPT